MRPLLPVLLPSLLVGCLFSAQASAQTDYQITTAGNTLVVTDRSGGSDTLVVSEPAAGLIRFAVAGRAFSVDEVPTHGGDSGAISLSGVTSIEIHAGAGGDTIDLEAFVATLPSVTVNGDAGSDTVNVNGRLNFSPGANFDIDLQNDSLALDADDIDVADNVTITTSEGGKITLKASRQISLRTGATLETANGDLIVEANQQTISTAGTFSGVTITGATLRSAGKGSIHIAGTGGNVGGNQMGVLLARGAQVIGGTTGTITLLGRGGLSPGDYNFGVRLLDANTLISSAGAHVRVYGEGGGVLSAGSNPGVECYGGAKIAAGGMGSVTVEGTGGNTTATGNFGVGLSDSGSIITSSGGTVSVTGTGGGNGASASNYGVYLLGGGQISSGGEGALTVLGEGGNLTGTGNSNYGLYLSQGTSRITSAGGPVTVAGRGGGANFSSDNRGVSIYSGVAAAPGSVRISAGGRGSVNVTGEGGNKAGVGARNYGVCLHQSGSAITSFGGDVIVTGKGGGAGAGIDNNGFFMDSNAVLAGSGGNVFISGLGGGGVGSLNNRGVQIQGSSSVSATGAGNVTLVGIGGSGTGSNHGIRLTNKGSVTAADGTIHFTGAVLDGTSASQGTVLSRNVSNGARIQTTGGGSITIVSDKMAFDSSGVSVTSALGPVLLQQKTPGTEIRLGSTGDNTLNTLELSDAELDVINAGTLQIGNIESGPISFTGVISPANYRVLALGNNTTFAPSSGFAADVGPTAGIYERITVDGTVSISNNTILTVASTGGFTWNGSDRFTLLAKTSTERISGMFNGPTLTDFLGSLLTAAQDYSGDPGNSLVIGPPYTALETWRKNWYGVTGGTGNAADTAVPYGHGLPNLLVYAFYGPNQNPATAGTSLMPQPQLSENALEYRFTEPAGVSGVTYLAEYCDSLTTGNWLPVPDSGTPPQHIFTLPLSGDRQRFMRLRVTAP